MKTPSTTQRYAHPRFAAAWLALTALSIWLAPTAKAFSPGADFSATNNPNGVWSYGYSTTLNGTFIPFTNTTTGGGLAGWNHDIASGDPAVVSNNTGSEISYSTITLEPGEIAFHPGPNDEICLIRFTAPVAGQYNFIGSFYGRDHVGTTTDVHLLAYGHSDFDGVVNGYGPSSGTSFSVGVGLDVGGTVDFAVGYGSNGNYYDDTTVVDATVTYVPAPPTVTLTSPPANVVLVAGATVPLTVTVLDQVGTPTQVQYFLNDVPVGAPVTAAPFALAATVPAPDNYTLKAVLTDDKGNTATTSETFTVVAADPNTPPPTIALDTPLDGLSLPANASLTLTFEAGPSSGTGAPDLSQVTLFADGVQIATFDGQGNPVVVDGAPTVASRPTRRDANAAPVPTIFQTPYQAPGTDQFVSLVAVALDALNRSTVSSAATFHATAMSDDTAPQAVFSGLDGKSSVFTGFTYPLTVDTVGALPAVAHPTAADPGDTLALLAYYIGQVGQPLGNAPPYMVNFQPTAARKYVLHAVATNAIGLSTISEPLILDAVAPAAVDLAVGGSGAAVEGGAKGIVVVTRTGGDTSQPLTVAYKVKGPAVAGTDYKPLSGSVTIPAGASKAKIKVKALDGSPNAGVLKLKFVLLPASDGSYTVGASPIKLKLIGK